MKGIITFAYINNKYIDLIVKDFEENPETLFPGGGGSVSVVEIGAT